MKEEEKFEVRLWLPKRVHDWFKENWEDVQKYYELSFLEILRSDLDAEPFLDIEGQKVQQSLEQEIAKLEGKPWKPWELDPKRARRVEVKMDLLGVYADTIQEMLKANPWMPQNIGDYILEVARKNVAEDLTLFLGKEKPVTKEA